MTLTLKNIAPSSDLLESLPTIDPTVDVSVSDLVKEALVEPIFKPIDPTKDIFIEQDGEPVDTESIEFAVIEAVAHNNVDAVVDVFDLYSGLVSELQDEDFIHPDQWGHEMPRLRLNKLNKATKGEYPAQGDNVLYTVETDLKPACQAYVRDNSKRNRDAIKAIFPKVTTQADLVGVAFANDSEFDQFKTTVANLQKQYSNQLTPEVNQMLGEFQSVTLDNKLTAPITVAADGNFDNSALSFMTILRHALHESVNAGNSFMVPFSTYSLFNPKHIVFINLYKHAFASKSQIIEEWVNIRKGAKSKLLKFNAQSIKALEIAAGQAQKQGRNRYDENERNNDATQHRANRVSIRRPDTNVLKRRIANILKKTRTNRKTMNVTKTRVKTYGRPNRRNQEDVDRPGAVIRTDYRPDIHIYQDTSGSISESNYAAATRMLIDIAKYLDVDVYYTSFSHVISETTRVRTKGKSPETIYKEITSIPKVSGGTDFSLVWDDIAENPAHRKQLAFVISDMDWNAPSTEPEVPKNVFYLPIVDSDWDNIRRCTERLLNSTRHYKTNLRKYFLY